MSFDSTASLSDLSSVKRYILINNNQLLCPNNGCWRALSEAELTTLKITSGSPHFIGSSEHASFWALEVLQSQEQLPESYQWLGLRTQLHLVSEAEFLLLGRALQTMQWHKEHQYCGRCGRATISHGSERAKLCDHCELRFYPRISPCIITLVYRDNECLLARHRRSSQPIYTALAGFVEIAESLEDAVHREINEEVGLKVQNLRYVASQPWPFPSQLMLGFMAEYATGELCLDTHELLDANWYRFDQLPQIPPIATLSGQLIKQFVQQHRSV